MRYLTVLFLVLPTILTDSTKGKPVKPPQIIVEPTPGYYEVEGAQIT